MTVSEARDKIDIVYGAPLDVLSSCLRGFLIPGPGKRFISLDFASIEARVLAWLAGEEHILQIFRGDGLVYEFNAAKIHNVPIESVTKAQRQIGKVASLALGFGGSVGAFQSMAENYGVHLPDDYVKIIVKSWREAHPRTVKYWAQLERASIEAVMRPGHEVATGRKIIPTGEPIKVKFIKRGSFLWCKLPSGRVISYPYPEMWKQVWAKVKDEKGRVVSMTFKGKTQEQAEKSAHNYADEEKLVIEEISPPSEQLTFMCEDSTTKKWERQGAYGGFLAENITQAVSRDLLVHTMQNLELKGYSIVMHVHDETVSEVDKDFGSLLKAKMIASKLPPWAKGLPFDCDGWDGARYGKV